MSRLIGLTALFFLMAQTATVQARTMESYSTAVLRLLDKGTARVEQVEVSISNPIMFGRLQIDLRSCQQTPPEEEPESAAYLVISAIRPGLPEDVLFRGWMFASNPALSALEHPLYDVWVIACKNANATSSSAPGVAPSLVTPPSTVPVKPKMQ